MYVVFGCLVFAMGALVFAPAVLTKGHWQIGFPRLALTMWFGAFFAGCSAFLIAMIMSVVVGVNADHSTSSLEAILLTIGAWVTMASAGAGLALVTAANEPVSNSHKRAESLMAARVDMRARHRGFVLARLDSDECFACALPGRKPAIVVTSTLRNSLSDDEFGAVLAHELAHIRQLHGWALRIAEVNELCLPRRFAAGKSLRKATLLLVELVADDTAARQIGPAPLANALLKLSNITGDHSMALRAERLTTQQWPTKAYRKAPAALEPRP